MEKYKNGFTLVELLVVILVISILSAAVITVINPAGIQSRSRDSQRIADLKTVQTALELYFSENRAYPSTNTGGGPAWVLASTASVFQTSYFAPISNAFVDPMQNSTSANPCTNPDGYRYNYLSDGGIYILTAIMEIPTTNESSECHTLFNWDTSFCGATFATQDVCYGVQNP